MKVAFSQVFFVILFGHGAASAAVDVSRAYGNFNITEQLEVAQSAPADFNFPQLSFTKNSQGRIAQGYANTDLWVKLAIKNSGSEPVHKLFYFDAPLVGELNSFEVAGGAVHQEVSGPGLPLDARAVPVRWGAINILLEPGQEKTYYIKISSHHAVNTQAFLADPDVYLDNESQAKTVFYFYLGGIICLVVYNLVLGVSTKQREYLLYSLFAGSFAVTVLALHGFIDTYLWANQFVVFSRYLMFFSSLTVIAATIFVESFLNITRDFPVGYWGARVIRAAAVVTLLGSFFVPHFRFLFSLGYWIDICVAFALLFFIYCAIYVRIKYSYVLADYFLVSWGAVMVGVLVWIFALHGLIQTSPWTQYSLIVANLGEMLILALGLAYKIKILDKEKKIALEAAADKERYHRLVKVLSHDVANTVSGVLFHTENLDLEVQNSPSKEHVSHIGRLATQLNEILNSVRAEEVLNSFKSQSLLEKVELRQACLEAIDHFSWELRQKNISVGLEVPDGLWVRAHRSALINQVLGNLLSNSIKFSDPGNEVGFRVEEKEKDTVLMVWDQGVGIADGHQQRLFEDPRPFSNPGTREERGTGFGTKLIAEYMKLFGGQVSVKSICRDMDSNISGTTVYLIFPRR